MQTVVLVGEDNPHGGDPRLALFDMPQGCAGDRLRRHVLQVSRFVYLRRLRRVNLCPSRWSTPTARARASELLAEYRSEGAGQVLLVLLGRKVAASFGLGDVPAFSIRELPGVGAAVLLPHPSGRCREWNEPGAYARAREVLREAAPGLPWGDPEAR